MIKVFISHPMHGKSSTKISSEREQLAQLARDYTGQDVIINGIDIENINVKSLEFLSIAIEALSQADIAVFGRGWLEARECLILHQCCKDYGVTVITE